jgi:hypothetical protein
MSSPCHSGVATGPIRIGRCLVRWHSMDVDKILDFVPHWRAYVKDVVRAVYARAACVF